MLAKCAVVPALHAPHATHDRLHTLQSGGARTPLLLSPESPLPRRLTVVPHAHLHRIAQSQSSEPTTGEWYAHLFPSPRRPPATVAFAGSCWCRRINIQFFLPFPRRTVLSETLISGGVKSRENTKKQDSGNRTNRLGAGEFVDLINIPDGPQKFASIAASLVGAENGSLLGLI